MRVRVVDGLLERGVIKIEIALVHAHVEMLAAEVDGIGTGLHVGDECVPGAGRRQKLYGFSRQYHRKRNLFSYSDCGGVPDFRDDARLVASSSISGMDVAGNRIPRHVLPKAGKCSMMKLIYGNRERYAFPVRGHEEEADCWNG